MESTLLDHIKNFLEYLEVERNVSQLTIRNYYHYLTRFNSFINRHFPEVKNPSDIQSDMVRKYRLYLARYTDEKGRSLKLATQGYHVISIRSFFKYLAKNNIRCLPPDTLDIPKGESKSLKFLTRDQLEKLLQSPEDPRDKAILEVLFSTGLRVSELVKLDRDKVRLKEQEFAISGKGGRIRVVFLSDRARFWLSEYLLSRKDTDNAVFIRRSGKKDAPMRLSARSVQRIVERYVKESGLSIKITPHGIRHTFATDLLSAGADLRAIQELLGHKSVATTQIYTHFTNPQLREIHQRFHRK
jgi:site-specific recombinase XerD